jgi:hypothetical protein
VDRVSPPGKGQFIANSQFGYFDDKQRSFPKKYLRPVAVMLLKL